MNVRGRLESTLVGSHTATRRGEMALLILFLAGCTRALPHESQVFAIRDFRSELREILRADIDAVEERLSLRQSVARSLRWLNDPRSQQYFPVNGITHDVARLSVYAFESILADSSNETFFDRLEEEFMLIEAADGGDQSDNPVLLTGYFAAIVDGSLQQSETCRWPLYRLPVAAATRRARDDFEWSGAAGNELPTRSEIELNDLLAGYEIVWLRDRFDAYVVHVNGSARVRLEDGSSVDLSHVATNGHRYTSIGRLLIRDGQISESEMSLQAIRRYFRDHPEEFEKYAWQNDRFVFFEIDEGGDWPRGSLGFALTPMRSIATDKSVYPPGCVGILSISDSGRFVVDQDSGGAITGPFRADLFIGTGDEAGERAGRLIERARLLYLILKPKRIDEWRRRIASESGDSIRAATVHAMSA